MMERVMAEEKPKGILHITSEQLPEIKDWKVGKKYSINLVVEQKSVNQMGKKNILDASFDILKATASGSKVSEEEYKDMTSEEKDKADEEEVMGKM